MHELVSAKAALATKEGDQLANWALDRMGTETMLANRVAMGRGLNRRAFAGCRSSTPSFSRSMSLERLPITPDDRAFSTRARPACCAGISGRSAHSTLPGRSMSIWHGPRAYARSDEAPRRRRLQVRDRLSATACTFGNPPHDSAAAVYARYIHGGVPTHAEYTTLEDYLFRTIAREARCGAAKPIHIHCLGFFGGYYPAAGSEPLQLESVFDDSTLRQTRFVLLHGGWPYVDQTLAALMKPNVYADFSAMSQILSPGDVRGGTPVGGWRNSRARSSTEATPTPTTIATRLAGVTRVGSPRARLAGAFAIALTGHDSRWYRDARARARDRGHGDAGQCGGAVWVGRSRWEDGQR